MKKKFLWNFSLFQKILLGIIAALLVFVLFASAIIITAKPEQVGKGLRKIDPSPVSVEKKSGSTTSVYTDLGQLIAITADNPAVILIITPYFSYPANDKAFFEEIAQKKLQLKSLILNYFSMHEKEELIKMGEDKVKKELIQKINEELMLGSISAMYFNEYIFLN